MDVLQALSTRRSIRKYRNVPLPEGIMQELLELGRYYPSGLNLQPLKFKAVTAREDAVFLSQILRWAGYLPGYEIGDDEGPAGYILIFGDRKLASQFDFAAGSACNQLLLAIHGKGLGGCCLAIHKKQEVLDRFGLDGEVYEPLYAIAVGYAKHGASTVDLTADCKYFLDEKGNFVVPKRTVGELQIL